MLSLLAFDIANAAKTILGIGGLIFVHELGHFLVGRMCGVRAEAFSIGFGPVIAKWQPGETEYRLSAVPLGGYVKFLGENPDERGDRDPRSFFAATYPRKAAIMLAGVTMNVIAAFVLFVLAFSGGVDVPAPVIGSLVPGKPAEIAGLLPGDRILTIDGKRIIDFNDVVQETAFSEEIDVVVERDGRTMPAVRIRTSLSEGGIHQIGVGPALDDTGLVIPLEGLAAHAAGLRPLDRVVAIDGTAVSSLAAAWKLHTAAQDPPTWTVERQGARVEVRLSNLVWRIGVAPEPDPAPHPNGLLVATSSSGELAGPAADAGLPALCRIVTLDGAPVSTLEDVRAAVAVAGPANREIVIGWTPPEGGATTLSRARPRSATQSNPEEAGIHRPARVDRVHETNVIRALGLGVDRTHRWVMRIFATLRSLFTGGVSAKQLQGPVALAKATYDTAEHGWADLFLFLGMISMNLAVLNVLPVPLLDGGQLAIITAEKIRGKPLPERVLEVIQWSGLILLLSFMLFVIVNDIRKL